MATYDLPAAMRPQLASFGLQKAGVQFRSPFNGSLQAASFVAERWQVSATGVPQSLRDAGAVEAFLNLMAGGVNYVRMGHPARPVPYGTLRGSPILNGGATRGASSLTLANCTPGATLLTGDMIGVATGTQLFQVAADCTANGGGLMTVPLVNRVRATCEAGTAVTWDRPTALFVCESMRNDVTFQQMHMAGAVIDFIEAWNPIDEAVITPGGEILLGADYILFGADYLVFS